MPRVRSAEPQLTGVFAGWRWPAIAGAVAIVIAGIVLLGSYMAYHEWPWSTYPTQLNACGRDFESAGRPQTRAQIFAPHHEAIVKVGDMPGWFTRGQLWAYADEPPFSGNCRVVMFVRGGADQFKPYALLGGP